MTVLGRPLSHITLRARMWYHGVTPSLRSAASRSAAAPAGDWQHVRAVQDAYSHPLFSSTSSRHRLLLRIMRPDPETDAPATVTTVARLATTHRFRGLADFQVVSGTAQPLDRSGASVPAANQAHSAEPSRLEAPMLVLPPLFAQSDSTFSYGYQGFARKDASSNIAWTPKAKQPLITWDAATPPALPPDSAEMVEARFSSPSVRN